MIRKIRYVLTALFGLIIVYFAVWPVPIDPVAWQAPPNPGYSGPFAANQRLAGLETLDLAGHHGPEDIAVDPQGRIYAATGEGRILRLAPDGSDPQIWADTGGRPLGMVFAPDGNLIVADSWRGLLSVSPSGDVRVLATEAEGVPFGVCDDLDVADDGRIYFSDASSKFGRNQDLDAQQASLLDLMEHGGHGRLIMHDPASGETRTLVKGLNFANGVALAHDQSFVLVNDMGAYRVVRYWLNGPKQGQTDVLIDALPGFPDNISTGLDGRFWIAFVAPRNDLVDALSGWPQMRKAVQRLPEALRPAAVHYGHIIAVDRDGNVLEDLQDPSGAYPMNTAVLETPEHLYIGSLIAPVLARLPKAAAGL